MPLKYPNNQVPKYPKKSKPRMTNSAAGAFFSSFRAWAFRVSLGTWVFGYLMARTINVVHAKEAYLSAIRDRPFVRKSLRRNDAFFEMWVSDGLSLLSYPS